MKSKLTLTIVITITIIIIMIYYFIINTNTNIETDKTENEKIELIENNYYECNGKSYELDNYTVYNIFDIHFQNGKLINGNKIQIFNFNNVDDYKNFEKEINEYFNPNSIIRDDNNLTITYEFSYYMPQKAEQSEQSYLEMMLQEGYQCKVN